VARVRTQIRLERSWHPVLAWRSLASRYGALRYAQIIPIALLLWGLDDVARFRGGAEVAGLRHALVVNSISFQLGGAFAHLMNDWVAAHGAAALASAWYYILFQGAITGVAGVVLIWRRAPTFRLHRNALIAVTFIGLVAFWSYPVAPPRMLPGYHDTIASAVPAFTSVVEGNGAAQFAAMPSLHVAWAIWVAIALCAVVRRPVLRAAIWLYPVATITDVLATANHFLLDVITAPAILLLAYAIVVSPWLARRIAVKAARRQPAPAPVPAPTSAPAPAPAPQTTLARAASVRPARSDANCPARR
jgi:hypothetical protein